MQTYIEKIYFINKTSFISDFFYANEKWFFCFDQKFMI